MPIARLEIVLLTGLALLAAQPCSAQSAVTVYGGYRSGGSFQQAASPYASLDLKGGGAASISFDWAIDGSRQGQVFASRQASEIPSSGAESPAVPLTLSYLHLGGINFFDGGIGRGPYVVGGLGITVLTPGLSGLSTELLPSINLGLGYQLPIAPSIALRFEVRGYLTAVNGSANLFCSGGCVFSYRAETLTQAEALLGVSFGF
jgi:hypothetical protein